MQADPRHAFHSADMTAPNSAYPADLGKAYASLMGLRTRASGGWRSTARSVGTPHLLRTPHDVAPTFRLERFLWS